MISIEDFVEDIVGKAMRGYKISVQELAAKSGASSTSIAELLDLKCEVEWLDVINIHSD